MSHFWITRIEHQTDGSYHEEFMWVAHSVEDAVEILNKEVTGMGDIFAAIPWTSTLSFAWESDQPMEIHGRQCNLKVMIENAFTEEEFNAIDTAPQAATLDPKVWGEIIACPDGVG